MSKMIGSTYELVKELGSGGGGVVYLANHLRLGKQVVLKADKKNITTRPEILRREVDILKNLKHPYIPQVHDYFIEDGKAYTAMELIPGESLNKPLGRGERFSQPQVIKWAKQLLEALDYLHSPIHGDPPRGYVHRDIKPGNIIRTPQNDICLIDFNIAFALGDENAIGHSPGYASPEHYGLDYSSSNTTASINDDETVTLAADDSTITLPGMKTTRKILPDVRSDIYSLGATLYHLLSGHRPANDAKEVIPLSDDEFSPQVVAIITKAMNPDPDLRYQTAAEMLADLKNLHKNDPRTKRLKRSNRITRVCIAMLLVIGVASSFVGLKRIQVVESWLKLSEYSQNALSEGDISSAIDYALEALPTKSDLLTPSYIPQAQRALTDALGVYDLSDGYKSYGTVELPSNPLFLEISPNGETVAAIYEKNLTIIDTETAAIKVTLPTVESALCEAHYLNDDVIIFSGESGISAYDISQDKVLWTGEVGTAIAISADGSTVAAVYKDDTHAVVYDVATGTVMNEIDFGGKHQSVVVNDRFANPNNNLFALGEDGTWLGVSFADGSLFIYNLLDSENDIEIFDSTSGYTHFEGGFYEQYFAFSATQDGDSIFAVVDVINAEQTGGFSSDGYWSVQADSTGVYVQTDNLLVKIHPVTGDQTPLITTKKTVQKYAISDTHTLIATDNGYMFFDTNANQTESIDATYNCDFLQLSNGVALIGSLDSPTIRILKYESHPDAQVFSYDSSYTHDEARISADGETVMLFRYDQFRIYGIDGTFITEVFIPDAEQVYDQQYRRDGDSSYLEVIYNDGSVIFYSAADGSIVGKEQREAPDLTLYEEFFTDELRITSPLHGTPAAYDIKTGKLVGELEEDAYLTYVTQVGDYIITQYVTADSNYYGYLLNDKCEILAYLPNICDIIGNNLYFDYPTGNIRTVHVYNIDELISIANTN